MRRLVGSGTAEAACPASTSVLLPRIGPKIIVLVDMLLAAVHGMKEGRFGGGRSTVPPRLTNLLLPYVTDRIVRLASSAHRWGDATIDFDDLNLTRSYTPQRAYAQSSYVGPDGRGEPKGAPTLVGRTAAAGDPVAAPPPVDGVGGAHRGELPAGDPGPEPRVRFQVTSVQGR